MGTEDRGPRAEGRATQTPKTLSSQLLTLGPQRSFSALDPRTPSRRPLALKMLQEQIEE